jgi:hypothetical protein
MKKFLKIIAVFIGVTLYSVCLITAGISYERSRMESTAVAQNTDAEAEYVVKLYNGEIWVFSENDAIKRLNIDYDSLRLYDKELFAKGINVSNLRELTELEEDFSS